MEGSNQNRNIPLDASTVCSILINPKYRFVTPILLEGRGGGVAALVIVATLVVVSLFPKNKYDDSEHRAQGNPIAHM